MDLIGSNESIAIKKGKPVSSLGPSFLASLLPVGLLALCHRCLTSEVILSAVNLIGQDDVGVLASFECEALHLLLLGDGPGADKMKPFPQQGVH